MRKLLFLVAGLASCYLFRKPLQRTWARIAASCPAAAAEDEVDVSSKDSFPASDPPSYTGAHA